jgi:ABC-type multidrug transport system fused ATPase/permease subunit
MTIFQKLQYILSSAQKKQVVVLGGLLFIGMLFEMAGLGVLIPALGMVLNSDIGKDYPAFQPYLKALGNPTQMQLVFWGMLLLIFVYLIKAVFLVFLNWRQSKFSTELSADLGQKLFIGYLQQPYTFHLQRNSAELLRNIITEIPQFTTLSTAAINLTLELSIVVGVAVLLILAEPLGAFVVIVFLGVSAFAFQRVTKKKLLIWGERRQYHGLLSHKHLQQGLGGVKDVKLLGRERYFLEEFNTHNAAYAKILMKANTLNLAPRAYLELLAVMGLAGLIIMMVLQGKPLDLLIPTLGVFVAAAFRMIPSVNRIMNSLQTIRFSKPVVDVLYNEFCMIKKAQEIKTPSDKMEFLSEITIKDLCFNYPNTKSRSLDGATLHIKKGESVGFIGPSGSGKSTLVDLILGLLSPASGEIRVDNQDIQKNLRGWQNQLGYVPQSIYLTDDTLRRNVAFGIANENIDDEAVARVILAAQLDEFVKSLPEGLETFVGERGVRLSGGQRQRIGIARALYHDPEVLVLDEATSALDSDTESKVMEAVNGLKGTKTLILIAHRISTLKNCDRIYSLKMGKLVSNN